jgi:3-hydroxybutyryl-CoA dehydrogenase
VVERLVPPGAQRWEPERVGRDGFLDARAKLVLLFADGTADVQRRWLAALGRSAPAGAAVALHAPRLSVSELAMASSRPEQVVGFGCLVRPGAKEALVEVAAGLRTAPEALAAVEAFLGAQGVELERVGDCSGLVLRRVLYAIINEAAFALWEGVASREDIDLGMKLGTNYPAGPLEWADAIGLDEVHAGLAGLQEEMGEDRYRPCPLLRKLVAAGFTGKGAGRGFFEYGAAPAGAAAGRARRPPTAVP